MERGSCGWSARSLSWTPSALDIFVLRISALLTNLLRPSLASGRWDAQLSTDPARKDFYHLAWRSKTAVTVSRLAARRLPTGMHLPPCRGPAGEALSCPAHRLPSRPSDCACSR